MARKSKQSSKKTKPGANSSPSISTKIDETNDPEYSIYFDQFKQELRETEELEIQKIMGDGNCLFRAIAYQLDGTEDNHLKYRTMAYNHISQNRINFQDYLFDQTVDEHLSELERPGTWGGQPEIQALCNQLNIRITVYLKGWKIDHTPIPSTENTQESTDDNTSTCNSISENCDEIQKESMKECLLALLQHKSYRHYVALTKIDTSVPTIQQSSESEDNPVIYDTLDSQQTKENRQTSQESPTPIDDDLSVQQAQAEIISSNQLIETASKTPQSSVTEPRKATSKYCQLRQKKREKQRQVKRATKQPPVTISISEIDPHITVTPVTDEEWYSDVQ